MIEDKKPFRRGVSTIKFDEQGVYLSDIHLAAVVLNLVPGAECTSAVPSNTQPCFLFYIKGDVPQIKHVISDFYSARIDGLGAKLKRFVMTVSYLKLLLQKAREGGNG